MVPKAVKGHCNKYKKDELKKFMMVRLSHDLKHFIITWHLGICLFLSKTWKAINPYVACLNNLFI